MKFLNQYPRLSELGLFFKEDGLTIYSLEGLPLANPSSKNQALLALNLTQIDLDYILEELKKEIEHENNYYIHLTKNQQGHWRVRINSHWAPRRSPHDCMLKAQERIFKFFPIIITLDYHRIPYNFKINDLLVPEEYLPSLLRSSNETSFYSWLLESNLKESDFYFLFTLLTRVNKKFRYHRFSV